MSLVETPADGNNTIIDGWDEDHENLPTLEECFVFHAFHARFANNFMNFVRFEVPKEQPKWLAQ